MHQPIKRHKSLQPLSRDHHQGLLLCWKIRKGIERNIESGRMRQYTDWFWKNHLTPHFDEEEQFVFPILGVENDLVKKAIEEHRGLKLLFESNTVDYDIFRQMEQDLAKHIRFEERILFNKIQKAATPEQLALIESKHSAIVDCEDWNDVFWL